MGLRGHVLLIGGLHFAEPEWAQMARVAGVDGLKAR